MAIISEQRIPFAFQPWPTSLATTSQVGRPTFRNALEDQRQDLAAIARSIAWHGDAEKSEKARRALLLGGSLAVPAVLQAVTTTPRAEVIEEGALILARLAAETGSALGALLDAAEEARLAPPALAAVARALGLAELGGGPAGRAAEALATLLANDAVEVRDAAVAALSDRGGPDARRMLGQALGREKVAFIREAIQEALAVLADYDRRNACQSPTPDDGEGEPK